MSIVSSPRPYQPSPGIGGTYRPRPSPGGPNNREPLSGRDVENNPDPKPKKKSGGGGEPIDMLSSTSYSGPPDWATKWIRDLIDKYGIMAFERYNRAVEDVGSAPGWIERARQQQNLQYNRDIQRPTMEAVKASVNQLAGGGMLNSSVSADWIAKMTQAALQGAQRQQTESNVWAANANAQNLLDRVTAAQGLQALLAAYLGETKYSESNQPMWPPGLSFGGSSTTKVTQTTTKK